MKLPAINDLVRFRYSEENIFGFVMEVYEDPESDDPENPRLLIDIFDYENIQPIRSRPINQWEYIGTLPNIDFRKFVNEFEEKILIETLNDINGDPISDENLQNLKETLDDVHEGRTSSENLQKIFRKYQELKMSKKNR